MSRRRVVGVSLLAHAAHTSSFVSPHTESQLENSIFSSTQVVPRRRRPPWRGLSHLIICGTSAKNSAAPLPPQHQPTGRSGQTDITVFVQAASRRCQIRFTCWTPLLAALARNQFVQFLNWEKPLRRPILTPSNPRSVDVTKFQILAERIPLHGLHE